MAQITPFQKLICPLDGRSLIRTDSSWTCESGHNFDIAKKGYVNLLPVQHKRSLDPGDHKEMVAARQRFLNAGFYKPVADAVQQSVVSSHPAETNISCLDAGCGEGYYLRDLSNTDQNQTFSLLGLDISKWAIMSAAKQDARPTWVVGNNANLPVESASFDVVLCMFGFPVYKEFARALKTGGLLLLVSSGPSHLTELRNIIYPEQKSKNDKQPLTIEGFKQSDTSHVKYTLDIKEQSNISDLLAMTPHFYRAPQDGLAALQRHNELTVTVDVRLSSFIRNAEPINTTI